ILVRASHQMRAFEDRFLTIGLPYRVIGGPRFYERLEIRDAMAYFRVAGSPADDLAFERIVNTPKRGMGDKGKQLLQGVARRHGVPLLEAARIAVAHGELAGKAKAEMAALVAQFDRWHDLSRHAGPAPDPQAVVEAEGPQPAGERVGHVELAEMILEESGYTAMWQAD